MSAPALGGRTLRLSRGEVSIRVRGRSVAVIGALFCALTAAALVTLSTGDYPLPLGEVLAALAGAADGGAEFIVTSVRLPRLLTAIAVGAALALSGALMQSLTRNPLGSPDIVGLTNGSATGALLVIVVFHGSMAGVAAGALVGGLATAVVVYLLAYRGGVEGFRFVLVGIGVGAMLLALNSYLITRASWQDALAAQSWLIGTVNGRGWDQAAVVGVAVLVLLPLVLSFGRGLALLEMGDDIARGLGVPVERTRLVLILVAVLLAAVATAVAGPIAFVALAAPHLVRGMSGAAGPVLVGSAVTGALLLVVGDLAVQRLFTPAQIPVGTATGILGGAYLMWLLAAQWRRGNP